MNLRITLDSYMLQTGSVLKAAREAFGDQFVDRYKFYNGTVKLIVTAEQLVRFQIARNDNGGKNLWQALNVEEVSPPPTELTVDVRPRCCR